MTLVNVLGMVTLLLFSLSVIFVSDYSEVSSWLIALLAIILIVAILI